MMKIAVIGTGYVGLVTGTCLAHSGHSVICVDIDTNKVKKLNQGVIPIYEPELDILFKYNTENKRLSFTSDLQEAVEKSEVIFLALPTPPNEDGSADLSYILKAAKDISQYVKDYKVIVNKSTVPVGTAFKVKEIFDLAFLDKNNVDVVSNPEFLREGSAVKDFMQPDRVVIGSSSEKAKEIMTELYSGFVNNDKIIYMDELSSELTKYVANSFLATKISFMNEIANLCEKIGADVDLVRKGIGSDDRIGHQFLYPGIGYGGSCFPKDVSALIKYSEDHKSSLDLLRVTEHVNDQQKNVLYRKILNFFDYKLNDKHFALWGLSFKPETDDIREAPSLSIINGLLNRGAKITVYDPQAMEHIKDIYGDKLNYKTDKYSVLDNVDSLIILTEWSEFKNPDFKLMSDKMKSNIIFDGRNVFNVKNMENLNFYYNSIGRRIVNNLNNE